MDPRDTALSTDRDLLRRAGNALLGPQWQRPLARLLGAHYPSGPRASIDDRYVRRVAAGEHPVPDWWWLAIQAELGLRRRRLADDRREIDRVMREISVSPRMPLPETPEEA